MLLFDFKAAFPSLSHNFLWEILEAWRLPRHIIRAIQSFYQNNSHTLRLQGATFPSLILRSGVRTRLSFEPTAFQHGHRCTSAYPGGPCANNSWYHPGICRRHCINHNGLGPIIAIFVTGFLHFRWYFCIEFECQQNGAHTFVAKHGYKKDPHTSSRTLPILETYLHCDWRPLPWHHFRPRKMRPLVENPLRQVYSSTTAMVWTSCRYIASTQSAQDFLASHSDVCFAAFPTFRWSCQIGANLSSQNFVRPRELDLAVRCPKLEICLGVPHRIS